MSVVEGPPLPPLADPASATLPAGRLRDEALTDTDRHCAMGMHVSALVGFLLLAPLAIVGPLAIWLSRKDQSGFHDDHGRETVNMVLTGFLFTLVLGMIPIAGWLALLAWYIVVIIGTIRGAVAATSGEYFRYPMTIRFIS